MIPQRVPGPLDLEADVCLFAEHWTISTELAHRIQTMQSHFPFLLSIFSGYRTREHQEQLLRDGQTNLSPDVSTHCSCPATGADLNVDTLVASQYVKNLFGQAATKAHLRWGGGAPFKDGVPIGKEWHHVDLGPRQNSAT